MTTAPTVYTQFGYTLALAERSLTAVLQDHLAERGVRPETWYALQLLTVRGPVLEREVLAADLASSRALNPELQTFAQWLSVNKSKIAVE